MLKPAVFDTVFAWYNSGQQYSYFFPFTLAVSVGQELDECMMNELMESCVFLNRKTLKSIPLKSYN
jgi:hypothetical protein